MTKGAETAEAHEALVLRFINEVSNGKRCDILEEILTDDAVLTSPHLVGDGRTAVENVIRKYGRAFKDLKLTVNHVLANAECAAVKVIVSGVNTHKFDGFKATNRRISMPMMCLFKFVDKRISQIEFYWDVQVLVSQLNTGEIQHLR